MNIYVFIIIIILIIILDITVYINADKKIFSTILIANIPIIIGILTLWLKTNDDETNSGKLTTTTFVSDVTTNREVNQTEITTTLFIENTENEYKYNLETSLIGVWSGEYIVGEKQVKLDLTIYSYNKNKIEAIFSFSTVSDKGSYFMVGSIIDEDKISLMGEQWIDRPTGYAFLDINGTISYNGMTITDDSTSLYIIKVSDDIDSIPQKKEITNEGYLSSLTPYRMNEVNDYMINNNYHTHTGNVYPNGFVATSGGTSPENVISVCSYSPFEMIYNLEKKYTYIQGKVGFDDVTVSSTDLFGVGSLFQGTATITFISNDEVLHSMELSTSDIPKEFEFSVNEKDQLIIKVDFPYYNFVTDNFNKFFNFIDVKLE